MIKSSPNITHDRSTEASGRRFLCACLCDTGTLWPAQDNDDTFSATILAASAYHGVEALLYDSLHAAGSWQSWPAELRKAFSQAAHRQAALELAHKNELRRILKALYAADVQALLLKGAALAYSLYPAPGLRTRKDTDLLIRREDRQRAHQTLLAHGYRRANTTAGELVSYQDSYSHRDSFGIVHVLDVHWRINNTQLFANSLDFAELFEHALPLTKLAPQALALDPVHSLLLACIHRIGHFHAPYYVKGKAFYSGNRLIWLYDIHLLAGSMDKQRWDFFSTLAVEKQLCGVCLHGFQAAREAFATLIPQTIVEQLTVAEKREKIKLDDLINTHWRYRLAEFKTLNRGERLQLLKEHLLPPKQYMLKKYHTEQYYLLPLLYLHRMLSGCFKQLRRIRKAL